MSLLDALYEACCRFVECIRRQRAQWIQRRRELQRHVRPRLEILPDRIVPAAPASDVWVGGFNSDWNNAGNWNSFDGNGNPIAAAVPAATTDVQIPTLAGGCVAPVIGVNGNLAAVCGSITDQSGTSLTINGAASLDLMGEGQKTSTWGNSTNAPALNVNGKLQVDNVGANLNKLIWLNGNITGAGNVYLANGGDLYVEQSASNLAPFLSVGKDGINNKNQTIASEFHISQAQATGNAMTGNLSIGQSITVYSAGRMYFDADTNQNSQGGIVYASGNTSGLISVYGKVYGTTDSGGQVLTVQPQVLIQAKQVRKRFLIQELCLGSLLVEASHEQARTDYFGTSKTPTAPS